MVIESIVNALCGLVLSITSFINIPDIPQSVMDNLNTFKTSIVSGYGLLSNYLNMSLVLGLLGTIIAIDVIIHAYYFIMWILRKIPVLNIS